MNSTTTNNKKLNQSQIEVLSTILKGYGFRNKKTSFDLLKTRYSEYISYNKYKTLFRSILKNSKENEINPEVGVLYKLKNFKIDTSVYPQKKVNMFFKQEERHQQGKKYTKYSNTKLLQEILDWTDKVAIQKSKFNSLKKEDITEFDFLIDIKDFHKIKEKDRVILFKNIKGSLNDKIVISNNPKGEYRKYSTFTRINDKTRKLSYKYNIDIDTGLQSFLLNFYCNTKGIEFHDLKEIFPSTYHYVTDKNHARESIAKITSQNIKEVKTVIQSVCYGGLKKEYNFKILPYIYRGFYEETKTLTDYLTENINIKDEAFIEYLNNKICGKSKTEIKNITVFSFLEYQEKQVRDIIIDQLSTEYQEVHDAVYTNELLDTYFLSDIILDRLDIRLSLSID